jgi:SAM-dependent methyltransferase
VSTDHAAGGTYRFGDTPRAAERLRLLAEVFAASSRDFLTKFAPRNPRRIADLGCGPGYTSRLLAEVFPAAAVRGLDSSANFIDLAKQSPQPRIAFEVADVTDCLPDGLYDLIYARYLLTHVPGFEAAIRLWSESLAPRGAIAIEENAWIETCEPAFARYLEIVGRMLSAGGQRLYVGADLAAIRTWPGLTILTSEVCPIEVTASAAASMFLPNLQTWREQAYVRDNVPAGEIERLERELETLAASRENRPAITFGRRRLALARAG